MEIKVCLKPRLIRPGEQLDIEVTIDGAQDFSATHVDAHIDLVGELRGRGYVISSLSKKPDGSGFAGTLNLQPNQPRGIMEIQALVFGTKGERCVRLSRRDYPAQYFRITDDACDSAETVNLDSEAASLYKRREEEFFSGWGSSGSPHNVYVFYRNCLARSGDVVLRKAKIFKMSGVAGDDVLNSIEAFFATRLSSPLKFESRSEVNSRFLQNTPCIAILFPNVFATSARQAYDSIHIPASHASLLMSADTGSAPEFIGAGIFGNEGKQEWIFNLPQYTGNLFSDFGPVDYFMNNQFEILNSRPEVSFYFSLYRDALAEQNPDLAYFRYWTFLETVARNKGFKGGELGVRQMLQKHGTKFNVNMGINFNGKYFPAERCISVWAARRNITAHFGAFDPSSIQQKAEHRSFEIATNAVLETAAGSDDFFLRQLKEIARLILSGLLNS